MIVFCSGIAFDSGGTVPRAGWPGAVPRPRNEADRPAHRVSGVGVPPPATRRAPTNLQKRKRNPLLLDRPESNIARPAPIHHAHGSAAATSQRVTTRSEPPTTRVVPSGEKASDDTRPGSPGS